MAMLPQVSGVKIHYETFGQGKPIILLHGFPLSFQLNWVGTNWVEPLLPVRRVVGLDCRGFGDSEKPHDPQAYGVGAMGDDVLRLMDHLGIENADLLGYSMGAMISAHLLFNHRERFTSVILSGAGDLFHPDRESRCAGPSTFCWLRTLADHTDPFGKVFRAIADGIPNNDRRALAAYCSALVRTRPACRFRRRRHPRPLCQRADDTEAGSPAAMAAATPGSSWSSYRHQPFHRHPRPAVQGRGRGVLAAAIAGKIGCH
jgi:pimeloyl-ACP methyl ester carboxylesterase